MSAHPLALLGGTFDPIHFGHLRLAEEVADALRLSQVLLVPAGQPPHRGRPGANALQRLRMCELAASGNPRLAVDGREVLSSALSYTVHTVLALRAEIGQRALLLLMGADAFANLHRWHRWQELIDACSIVVTTRPGYDLSAAVPEPLRAQWPQRATQDISRLRASAAGLIYQQPITALDISASRIRQLLARGESVRYLLPDAVANYLVTEAIYAQTG